MHSAMHNTVRMTTSPDEPRLIRPSQLLDVTTVAARLGVHRSTVTRRIAAGTLTPFAKLPSGDYVFDALDLPALEAQAGK